MSAIEHKKACDSFMRELYNILTEFHISVKLVRPIKLCLKESYSKVHISKLYSDAFCIQNGLKQGDAFDSLCTSLVLRS
jgi:hypothetical protein